MIASCKRWEAGTSAVVVLRKRGHHDPVALQLEAALANAPRIRDHLDAVLAGQLADAFDGEKDALLAGPDPAADL